MLSFEGCVSRRDFLRAGALTAGTIGLTLPQLQAAGRVRSTGVKNCIVLFLVGGPSHLDTWDPKPGAPENIRGPFRPIQTNVPGIFVSENFPRMARRADQYAIVRSVFHRASAIHETGQQLLQTGRLCRGGMEHPSFGAVLSQLGGKRNGMPTSLVLPSPIGNTGVSMSHGQGAGFLGQEHEPIALSLHGLKAARSEAESPQSLYGRNTFGQSCLMARRLVESGVRLVTVNMFDTVFNNVTWDCHADGGSLATTLDDYRDTLCPMFDQAYTTLLDDLRQRGLLEETLVVAMGEFGRTPQLNPRGGRDHWPHVWSILFAGGPVRGGQVIGSSDKHGAEPRDRPVHAPEIAATVYHALGVDLQMRLTGPDGVSLPLVEADPVWELVG